MNKNFKKSSQDFLKKTGKTIKCWALRVWKGGSNALADEMESDEQKAKAFDVEEIVSPGRQILNNFMERKLAVGALILLLAMFVVMLIGPLMMPKYTDAYTEVTQKSIPPTRSMMSVPRELRKDIKMIDGFGSFSVGLSNAGKVYVWGATKIGTTGIDVADIPQEVQDANIVMVAAGIDHIVAISDEGKVYCWGNNKLGQFGTETEAKERGEDLNPNIAYEPEILATSGIDVSRR